MPTVNLTAKSVMALPAREDGGRIDYSDAKATGLMLRVTGKARTFCVVSVNGVARRLTLGPVEDIGLAEARARASTIRDQARVGVDAVVVKHKATAAAQRAKLVGETFADLAARYLESAARGDGMKTGEPLAPRTLAEYRRILKADVLPALGAMAPGEVARAHVRLFDSIRAAGHAVHANRVLATVKSIFSWTLRKDLVTGSPCAGLAATRARPRERVYSDAELRVITASSSRAGWPPCCRFTRPRACSLPRSFRGDATWLSAPRQHARSDVIARWRRFPQTEWSISWMMAASA